MTVDHSVPDPVGQAWQLFASGDLAGAIAQARAAAQPSPSSANACAALGFFLIRAGELDEAAAVLLPAREREPQHAPLHWYIGYLLQHRGDVPGAAASFQRACTLDHSLDEAAYALAWTLNDLGRTDEALHWASRSLARARLPQRLLQTGWLQQASGHPEQAMASYREAVQSFDPSAPEQARLHLHLSQCMLALKRDAHADAMLEQALARWPDDVDLRVASGWRQHTRGDLHGALHQAQVLVREYADDAAAWHLLGTLQYETGDLSAAEQSFAEVLRRKPMWPDALLRRARIHWQCQQFDDARLLLQRIAPTSAEHAASQELLAQVLLDLDDATAARRVLVLYLRAGPRSADAWRLLAVAQSRRGRTHQVLRTLRRALRLAPEHSACLRQLGRALTQVGAHEEARHAFLRAVESDPHDPEAQLDLAGSHARAGDFEAGLACVAPLLPAHGALVVLTRILTESGLDGADDACARLLRNNRHAPDAAMAALRLVGLGNEPTRRMLPLLPVALLQSTWRRAIELGVHTQGHAYLARLAQAAREDLDDEPWLRMAALYVASLSLASNPQDLARQARAACFDLRLRAPWPRLPVARLPAVSDGRLRIAYVAGQLHHSLLRRVLAAHVAERVHVCVYTNQPVTDLPEHVQLHPLDAATLAESCAANRIDVVIDAGGVHPFEGQFEVLQAYARRVAPVQVGWLGCWGSAGGLFDALLTDEVSVPAGQEDSLQEIVLRLDGGQWCWDPPADAPPTGAPPVLKLASITFGVTARSLKLDDACLRAFADVLSAVPGSTIRFIGEIAGDWPQRRDVLAQMQSAGVALERVFFDPFMPRTAYLRWLNGIDLVLDSFPGNGGLSMLDPLWMGVPVVTLAGAWPGARQSASVLAALDLEEWMGHTVEEFCAKATALARDAGTLSACRSTLRARMLASPLLDGRRVATQIEDICEQLTRTFAPAAAALDRKSRIKAHASLALDLWLTRPRSIAMPTPALGAEVDLSVIVVLFNQAGLSRATLQSLADQRSVRFETVIVDNASSDRSHELLVRVSGAHIIRNADNAGFLRAARQGAAAASGRYLLFVNNDAVLHEDALQATLRTLRADPSIGALGARVVLAEGGLQEAGNKVFGDGSAGGIGRGEDAFGHAALAGRSTDYVSGVFLATPASLWRALDGFDERLAPAYYEDTDYCLRVWQAGFRVWYEPAIVVEHLESGSATGGSAAALMDRNREIFCALHALWLARQPHPQALPLDGDCWTSPDDQPRRPRVLFVDNEVPLMFKGGGLPRARLMLQALRDWPVTLFPLWELQEHRHAVYASLPHTVEVALGHGLEGLEAFLERRRGVYDVMLVSRPTNLQALKPLRARRPDLLAGMRLVYDAEALFALREIAMAGVNSKPLPRAAARARIDAELALAAGASDVLVVSERDARYFEAAGHRAHVLSHSVAARRNAPGPAGRTGLLFIGALHPDTPNEDGLLWFIREVMPLLRRRRPASPVLSVVGVCMSERVAALAGADVQILGPQDDLTPRYDSARVFVAPVRFAGGVPAKAIEAAASGLPTVASALLVRQLGWHDGTDIMGARDAPAFASAIGTLLDGDDAWRQQQQAAWNACARHYAPDVFAGTLRRVLMGSDGTNVAIPAPDGMVQASSAMRSVRTPASATTPEHPLQRPTIRLFARLMARGQQTQAEAVLHQALAVEPNLPLVHLALARLRWPGPDYKHWLAWLHRNLRPGLYLEIGVEKGESLALARAPTHVIGVDPAPIGDPLAGCSAPAKLYRQTSAQFLAAPPADCGLHERGFDLAFVDGDHRFENVLDDLIGVEAWAAPGALLVLHDTWPLNELTAAPQRNSGFYSGDGWKIAPCLRALRPDLKVITLPVAPTGLTLIAGLDPRSQVLRERRGDILQAYATLDAARAVEHAETTLGPLGVNDQEWVRRWLQQTGVVARS